MQALQQATYVVTSIPPVAAKLYDPVSTQNSMLHCACCGSVPAAPLLVILYRIWWPGSGAAGACATVLKQTSAAANLSPINLQQPPSWIVTPSLFCYQPLRMR
jgi:hypothetical protein